MIEFFLIALAACELLHQVRDPLLAFLQGIGV